MDVEGYRIRAVQPADDSFLREMLVHSIYTGEGNPPAGREVLDRPEIAKYVRGWGRPGDLGFLAVVSESGEPVGAAWIRLFGEADPGYGFLAANIPELAIAVKPAHRGRGLGTVLIRSLVDQARGDHAAISLSVSVDNPARGLYARLGFEEVRIREGAITMRKMLGQSSDRNRT